MDIKTEIEKDRCGSVFKRDRKQLKLLNKGQIWVVRQELK